MEDFESGCVGYFLQLHIEAVRPCIVQRTIAEVAAAQKVVIKKNDHNYIKGANPAVRITHNEIWRKYVII